MSKTQYISLDPLRHKEKIVSKKNGIEMNAPWSLSSFSKAQSNFKVLHFFVLSGLSIASHSNNVMVELGTVKYQNIEVTHNIGIIII